LAIRLDEPVRLCGNSGGPRARTTGRARGDEAPRSDRAGRNTAGVPGPRPGPRAGRLVALAAFGASSIWEQIDNAHLRVEVWENAARGAVAVAFGGTVFDDPRDWLSNLRWFIPHHDDEYTLVVRTFAPAFAEEYKRRFADSSRPVLFSTGHSLGGGLAQQFAYALPVDPAGIVPRVSEVYAFDPSPVTGYFSVAPNLRESNSRDLSIDRIYERGEILALVRSLMSLVQKASAQQPAIGGTRYSLFYGWNLSPITRWCSSPAR
jgi:hypothetical protein